MNTEANFISPLEQGVFPESLFHFTIIWVEKKPHVGAVLTVLVFDVTSCFETTAEPYGRWINTLLCPLQSQPSASTFLRLLSPPLSSCFVALVITATSSHSCRLVNEILLLAGSSLWTGFFLSKCDEREACAKKELCHYLLNHWSSFCYSLCDWWVIWLLTEASEVNLTRGALGLSL